MTNKPKPQKARKPDYTSDGVAVWVNKAKNNRKYLTIHLVGHTTITAFENKPIKK
jgi:hypothetical protein